MVGRGKKHLHDNTIQEQSKCTFCWMGGVKMAKAKTKNKISSLGYWLYRREAGVAARPLQDLNLCR